jgi:hypothetical protein
MKIMLREKNELTATIREYGNQFRKIPLLLRLFTIACFFIGVQSPLQAIVPGMGLKINGTYLSWSELWQTGNAFALLATGPIHLAVPYGVWQRKKWVRPLLVWLPLFQILPFEMVAFLFGGPGFLSFYYQNSTMMGIFLPIAICAVALYLYRNQSVCSYFEHITEK